jgi:RNA-directed DNA polymerase
MGLQAGQSRRAIHGPLFPNANGPDVLEVPSTNANLYMNRFLKYWRITGRGELFQAQIVNYADDFVILSRPTAAGALDWTRVVMSRIGLTLNEAKTHIRKAKAE